MKIDDNLSEVFGVPTMPNTTTEVIDGTTGEIVQSSEQKLSDDYDTARDNMYDLLTQGKQALTVALEVAKQSEHPRAIEVVGNLMKQLADMNQQLLDLHQQKQKIEGPTKKTGNVTNNAIFVGSTAELNKMIKNMNKGE